MTDALGTILLPLRVTMVRWRSTL